MSNIFKQKQGASGDNIDEDYLSSGGILSTDIYPAKIKVAYMMKSNSSDALSMNLLLDVNGIEVRSQIWMTNGKGDVTYKDKKTGDKKNLPGYSQVTALCLVTLGKELGDLDIEEKTLKLYDFTAKKEIPQAVDCFVELFGQNIQIALQEQILDKTSLNESTGKYDPTGETRKQNEIIKFFSGDKLVTISEVAEYIKSLGGNFNEEIENGNILKAISKMDSEQGNYGNKWVEKNKSQVYDKSTGSNKEGKAFNSSNASKDTSSTKSSLFD